MADIRLQTCEFGRLAAPNPPIHRSRSVYRFRISTMNLLIVDDEAPARDRLRRLLEEIGDCEIVAEAGNGEEALAYCSELQPDIVLLDVRMPGLSGIEVARHIDTLEDPPAVIFTTAYDQYAVEAFETEAVGYLLKPVRKEKLAHALRHAGAHFTVPPGQGRAVGEARASPRTDLRAARRSAAPDSARLISTTFSPIRSTSRCATRAARA